MTALSPNDSHPSERVEGHAPHDPRPRGSDPWVLPIRDLGLTIVGSPLEPILVEFEAELQRVGIRRLRPRFYLSTEWGVCEGTIAIAIPFYLARPDLTTLHAERVGHVEGVGAGRHPPLPPARDGTRRQLCLRALRDAKSGSSDSARWTSRTARSIASSRSAGDSSAICPAGTRRSTPTRTGRRPSPSG